jgi:hypothetical protein
MKITLCFLISYDHILKKEEIWKEWIYFNKDIINVYFHYRDFSQIKSDWIRSFAIPEKYIVKTDYLHVVPAYFTLMNYAVIHDKENQWFCFLTDSCVPIISPTKFREMFEQNYNKSIIKYKSAWWNINFHNRANLKYLTKEFHLGNDPWFLLKREDVENCIKYKNMNKKIYNFICKGIIANESIFAIILKTFNQHDHILNESTHITDWDNMSSSTSPYVFKFGNNTEVEFILNALKQNKYSIFLRKIDLNFPDFILKQIIYQ